MRLRTFILIPIIAVAFSWWWATGDTSKARPKRSVDELFAVLQEPDRPPNQRHKAIDELAEHGPGIIPKAVDLLTHPQALARMDAAMLLARLAPPSNSVSLDAKLLPQLLTVLKDEQWPVRKQAAVALRRLPAAEIDAATPDLTAALTDAHVEVRNEALAAIASRQNPTPLLQKVYRDSTNERRLWSLEQLGVYIDASASAMDFLIDVATQENDDAISQAAFTALSKTGPPATSRLTRCADNSDVGSKPWRGTVSALRDMKPKPRELIPILLRGLQDGDNDQKFVAATSLGEFGPDAKEAIPALIAALSNENKSVVFRAVISLGQIGPGARKAIPGIPKQLRDGNELTRQEAAIALDAIDPSGASSRPAQP